jgi:hypothetical protein
MAINNNFVGGYNPYAQGLATSQPKSLLDQKLDSIYAKNEEKLNAIAPTSDPSSLYEIDNSTVFSGGLSSGGEDLWDVAQASALGTGGNLSDLATGNVRTNQEVTDAAREGAGLSNEGYQRLVQDKYDAVKNPLAEGRYLDALANLPGAIMPGIADSAGSLAGMLAGSAAVAGVGLAAPAVATGLGLAAVGQKLYKGAKTAENVVDAVQSVKKASMLAKTAKITKEAIKAAPKAAAQMSLVTADMTQSQVNTYRENFGVDPSMMQVVGMTVLNLGSVVLNPAIVKNLMIPAFKEKLKEEIAGITKNIVKGSNLLALGEKVGQGIKRVGLAGLAEGTQEYVQAWVEVVNTQIGPEDTGKFLEAVSREIGDEENQLNAIFGAYIGAGAGGGIRAGTALPGLAASGSLDLAKATAKGTVGVSKAVAGKGLSMGADMVARGSEKILTPENRAELQRVKAIDREVANDEIAELETKITGVNKVSNVEELMSDDLSSAVILESERWTSEELKDPKQLERAKSLVVSKIKKMQAELNATVNKDSMAKALGMAGGNTATLAKKAAANAKKAAKAVVAYTDTEKLIATVSKYGSESVEAVKNMESGTAKGLVDLAITGTKASYQQAVEDAADLSVSDIKNVITVLGQKEQTAGTVKLAKKLGSLVQRKVSAAANSGLSNKSETKSDNVSGLLVEAAKNPNMNKKQSVYFLQEVNQVLRGSIKDLEALKIVEDSYANYKKSSSYKDNALDNATLEQLLAKQSKRIREPLWKGVKQKISTAVKSATDTGLVPYLKDTEVVGQISEFMENDPTSQEFVKKLTEIVSSAKGTVGESIGKMPDITTDEGAKEFNKIATDLYNNLTENLSETLDTVESLAVGRAKSDSNNAKRAEKTKQKIALGKFKEALAGIENTASKSTDNDKKQVIVDSVVQYLKLDRFGRVGITTNKEATDLISGYPNLSKSVNIANAIADAFPEVESKNPEPESEVDVEQDVEQDLDDDSTIEYYTGSEHSTSEVEYKYIDQAELAQMYINKYGMTCAFKLKSK